ncbi:DUF3269 family protein [Staphylococcus pettenkoferi]|uniref:DUF3269 family protein n=1 Tax=Staphylococcus pettenkoferi TaxID=170573 RepID=UPI000CD0B4AC|nr:DUF3269 family protein [Staphylococcus pettenkoferi]MCY1585610.1 DUF3269 family protein [Staphylococcus pettenkoferi]PNZ87667.1 hypothetical protein CD126_08965 [Staphylococcus pettenkoferi]QQC36822.1 DUF3269 family protein [Staphylococcus pettenkoferi]
MQEENDQYYLFTSESERVFRVTELGDGDFYVDNLAGQRYWNVDSKMMTPNSLNKFKANHNLYLEEELNSQATIFDM